MPRVEDLLDDGEALGRSGSHVGGIPVASPDDLADLSGVIDTEAARANLDVPSTGEVDDAIAAVSGANLLSDDETLANESTTKAPTERAAKAYVDQAVDNGTSRVAIPTGVSLSLPAVGGGSTSPPLDRVMLLGAFDLDAAAQLAAVTVDVTGAGGAGCVFRPGLVKVNAAGRWIGEPLDALGSAPMTSEATVELAVTRSLTKGRWVVLGVVNGGTAPTTRSGTPALPFGIQFHDTTIGSLNRGLPMATRAEYSAALPSSAPPMATSTAAVPVVGLRFS